MANTPKNQKPEDIETRPDAWEWFEGTVDAAIKSGPKHRTSKGKKKEPTAKGSPAK